MANSTRTVRFTTGQLGLMRNPEASSFEDEVVRKGDTGTYVGTHPALPDWHVIEVTVNGRTLVCPCHASQFEDA